MSLRREKSPSCIIEVEQTALSLLNLETSVFFNRLSQVPRISRLFGDKCWSFNSHDNGTSVIAFVCFLLTVFPISLISGEVQTYRIARYSVISAWRICQMWRLHYLRLLSRTLLRICHDRHLRHPAYSRNCKLPRRRSFRQAGEVANFFNPISFDCNKVSMSAHVFLCF